MNRYRLWTAFKLVDSLRRFNKLVGMLFHAARCSSVRKAIFQEIRFWFRLRQLYYCAVCNRYFHKCETIVEASLLIALNLLEDLAFLEVSSWVSS